MKRYLMYLGRQWYKSLLGKEVVCLGNKLQSVIKALRGTEWQTLNARISITDSLCTCLLKHVWQQALHRLNRDEGAWNQLASENIRWVESGVWSRRQFYWELRKQTYWNCKTNCTTDGKTGITNFLNTHHTVFHLCCNILWT